MSEDETVVIPVLAEEVDIGKRQRDTGGVRATKIVREREEVFDEPLLREEVTTERIAVNRVIDAPVAVRQEGDTMIIPVMEEVLVVQRRLLLKEEIHIRKRQIQVREPQRFVVRSEEVRVERLGAEGDAGSPMPVETETGEKKGGTR